MSGILNLLGLPGAIAIVFSGIIGAFNWIEKESGPDARRDIAHFLKSTDWDVLASRLPDAFWQFFKRIFGERHFSWFCMRRSVYFSSCAIIAFVIVGFILHRGQYLRQVGGLARGSLTLITVISGNIVADYFNLLVGLRVDYSMLVCSPRCGLYFISLPGGLLRQYVS